MSAVAERFSYPTTSVLNSNFSPVSRLTGQTIIPDNYGAYNGFTEIVVGATNVGTVLTFTQKIRNYLYIDITFQGNAAAVIVYGPARILQFTQGASGVICGQQTRRIPYCGDIESLTFLQTNYTVKSIEVVSKFDPYSAEMTDLAQLDLQNTVGWTYADGTYSISLAASSGKTVGFAGTLLEGFVGRMGIRVILSSAPNVSPTDILYSDGVNVISIPMLNEDTILWLPDIIGSIVFTNNLNSAITLQLTPTVVSFLGVSTVFGAAIPTT